MSATVKVTSENWSDVVENAQHPVLVDFWAEWCGPCRAVAPVLDEIAQEKSDSVTIAKVNSDENPDLARKFQIMSIPTLLVFKDGEMVDSLVGAHPKNTITELIEKAA